MGLEDRLHNGSSAGTVFVSSCWVKATWGTSYKYPKLRIASNENFVRRLTCRFQITLIGRDAKRTSVIMLMIELNIPIAVKRWLSKHFAFGSLARSHEALMGTQEKRIV